MDMGGQVASGGRRGGRQRGCEGRLTYGSGCGCRAWPQGCPRSLTRPPTCACALLCMHCASIPSSPCCALPRPSCCAVLRSGLPLAGAAGSALRHPQLQASHPPHAVLCRVPRAVPYRVPRAVLCCAVGSRWPAPAVPPSATLSCKLTQWQDGFDREQPLLGAGLGINVTMALPAVGPDSQPVCVSPFYNLSVGACVLFCLVVLHVRVRACLGVCVCTCTHGRGPWTLALYRGGADHRLLPALPPPPPPYRPVSSHPAPPKS